MRAVHYMCRAPGNVGALLYPYETDDSYQANGSFFLAGLWTEDVHEVYSFTTLRADVVQDAELVRVHGSTFEAEIDGIGRFSFRASTMGTPARYIGSARLAEGPLLVRQLVPHDRRRLEAAAIENGFVFLGHSPGLDEGGGITPAPQDLKPRPPQPLRPSLDRERDG